MRLPKRSQLLSLGLLALVIGIALAETIAASYSYRRHIHERDWLRAAEEVADYSGAIVLGSDWLGPRARMKIPRLAESSTVGRPDLRGIRNLLILTDSDDGAWPNWLVEDLEEMDRPQLLVHRKIGGLAAYEYEFSAPETIRWNLLDEAQVRKLKVSTDEGRCRYAARTKRWNCPDGKLEIRFAEIDYRARRCLAVDLAEGSVLHIDLSTVSFNPHTILRGHLGFDDFDSRLRSDAAVQLSITSNDYSLARWIITDDEGWKPMALAFADGQGEALPSLRLDLLVSWPGTFSPEGYREQPRHTPCIEFRGLEAAKP